MELAIIVAYKIVWHVLQTKHVKNVQIKQISNMDAVDTLLATTMTYIDRKLQEQTK